MLYRNAARVLKLALLFLVCVFAPREKVLGAHVTIRAGNVILIDGAPVFPIGFTKAPPPDGKTPAGGDAYAELKKLGAAFHRFGPTNADLDHALDRSAAAGIFVAITLPDLQTLKPGDTAKEAELRRIVEKYRRHPALVWWKGEDEPEWGKKPVPQVQRFYDIVHELDHDHPVWITQAPRGTIESLKQYDPTYDIAALDIYPVSYPPGLHGHLPNKNISMVGDYARWMREVTAGRKPFFMVLQIAFSGVVKPGRTLRFPTFPEQRYMTYQSIINGARGLIYFGGDVQAAWNDRDRSLGWNWTYFDKVLKPVLEELRPGGPIFPALVAPDSKAPVKVENAPDIEFCVREAGQYLYLLAAKREGSTIEAKFTGLPVAAASGEVLFEEPRKVAAEAGTFTDWFGPNEVHVYRFERTGARAAPKEE